MNNYLKHTALILLSGISITFAAEPSSQKPDISSQKNAVAKPASIQPKVVFVELGSINCVPCKMMQPVMKNLEEKFPRDLKVVFHDVWTDEGKPAGQKYGIRAIPTQVFLDAAGKEISRHEGFFPQTEIEKILKAHGVVK